MLERKLVLVDTQDESEKLLILNSNSSVIASFGPLIAISEKSTSGPVVNITSVESDLVITIPLEPRSDERTDRSIENSGVPLEFENSSVVELELESNWLVATVDVGQFNRTLLVDTLSFNLSIISNPRWDSSSPSIGNGMVAFLQVTRDD